MSEGVKILLPKIKAMEFKCKVMLDPADFRKGLPRSKMPELHEKGIIVGLKTQRTGTAKTNVDGSLKLNVVYNAEVLGVVGRYIEVRVIDDYGEEWVGVFLGMSVRGSGGDGQVRGCRVLRIEGNRLVVEAVSEAGNPLWEKLQKKVEGRIEEANNN